MAFQSVCFATYNGWGRDALLRTQFGRRQQSRGADWKKEWNELFSDSPSSPTEVQGAYAKVMESFAKHVGVNHSVFVPTTGTPPINVR